MKNFKQTKIFSVLFLIGFLFLNIGLVKSDEVNVQQTTLTIVKYGLNPGDTGFSSNQTTNDGTKINNLPTDDAGKQLKPLANVSYVIQQIVPHDVTTLANENPNPSDYDAIGNPITVTTDSSGQVSLDLPDGYYLVSEQANLAINLKKPAAPVVVSLPVMDSTSDTGYLSDVYIYPKSSVEVKSDVDGNTDDKNPNHTGTSSSNAGKTTTTSNATSDKSSTSNKTGNTSSNLTETADKKKNSNDLDGNSTSKVGNSNTNSASQNRGLLPDTGDLKTYLTSIGFGILLIILVVLINRKRKENEKVK